MGLLLSIPKDVLRYYIPYLSYRDRIHLTMLDKNAEQFMYDIDPFIQYRFESELLLSLKTLILENQPACDIITYTSLFMQEDIEFDLDTLEFAQFTTNLVIIAFFRSLCSHKLDFDQVIAGHLYTHFGEQIPEKYFKILSHKHYVCAGFARIGNYNLFMKFMDKNRYDFDDDYEVICYYAGIGANKNIINHLIRTKPFEVTKHIVGAMFYNGNTNALNIVEKNEELMEFAHKIITLPTSNNKTFHGYYRTLENFLEKQNKRRKI
jgi:hypothetical protein